MPILDNWFLEHMLQLMWLEQSREDEFLSRVRIAKPEVVVHEWSDCEMDGREVRLQKRRADFCRTCRDTEESSRNLSFGLK